MTDPGPTKLTGPDHVSRHAVRLALVGVLVAGLLWLLWWIDPRQVAVPLCSFHQLTGLHCPGCGVTRATHELLHGRLISALRHNALWILTLPLAVYAVASETRYLLRGRPLWGNPTRDRWFLTAIVMIVVLFSVLRNVPLGPFCLLAPPG